MRGISRYRRSSFLGCAGLLLLVGLGVWWGWFKYGECRKVGHSVMYCVMTVME